MLTLERLYEIAGTALEPIAAQNPMLSKKKLQQQFVNQFDRLLREELVKLGKEQDTPIASVQIEATDQTLTIIGDEEEGVIHSMALCDSKGQLIKNCRFREQHWGTRALAFMLKEENRGRWFSRYDLCNALEENLRYHENVRYWIASALQPLSKRAPCLEKKGGPYDGGGDVVYRVNAYRVVWKEGS